jgi:hypothetical protein
VVHGIGKTRQGMTWHGSNLFAPFSRPPITACFCLLNQLCLHMNTNVQADRQQRPSRQSKAKQSKQASKPTTTEGFFSSLFIFVSFFPFFFDGNTKTMQCPPCRKSRCLPGSPARLTRPVPLLCSLLSALCSMQG